MSKPSNLLALVTGVLFALTTTLVVAADTPTTPAKDTTAKAARATKATPAAKKAQEMCPVMNSEINKKLFVDKDGKRIYMCCPACKEKIETDFDKYAKQLEDQGIDLAAPKDASKDTPKK
jgi:mannitol-specific phosphotransferase system IIBC component